MQLNFSAPRAIARYLKDTKGSKSLSRHILDLVVLGMTKCERPSVPRARLPRN